MRCGQVSATNPNLILSGSYDSTMRLLDARTGKSEMVMGGSSVNGSSANSAPVEQVLMFPSGTIALSAAGPILRVWDLVAGGRCTRAFSNHQKTITSLAFDGEARRLLTGGLDQMVKVYDVSTYKVVHTMRYPSPVLCLAISVSCTADSWALARVFMFGQPDETHIAAGMSDGTLSVRRRQPKAKEAAADASSAALHFGSLDAFLGSSVPSMGLGKVKAKGASTAVGDINELRVEGRRSQRLREYDRLLKKFRYSAALDAVLRKVRLFLLFVIHPIKLLGYSKCLLPQHFP